MNRTVPSTCSVFPCITGCRRASTGFRHRPSTPNPAAQHPQPCLLLLRRSNECRFPSHHTKTAHALSCPALPRARGGVQVFSTSGPKCSKTCTPPRPRPSTPNPAYCFSEEVMKVGFLPTIQRQHMICIPLHCRGRAGEYRFSALSGPKCSKTCTPPRPRASTNRTGTEPLRTAMRFIPVQVNPTEPVITSRASGRLPSSLLKVTP